MSPQSDRWENSMKPTLLGLIVSAVAFAGSTYYFWQQLQVERDAGVLWRHVSRA
jgi:hypothetical protein